MTCDKKLVSVVVFLSACAAAAFSQDRQIQPSPVLPTEILGPQLIAWSQVQQPQPIEQTMIAQTMIAPDEAVEDGSERQSLEGKSREGKFGKFPAQPSADSSQTCTAEDAGDVQALPETAVVPAALR
jgi:hypothetical protein